MSHFSHSHLPVALIHEACRISAMAISQLRSSIGHPWSESHFTHDYQPVTLIRKACRISVEAISQSLSSMEHVAFQSRPSLSHAQYPKGMSHFRHSHLTVTLIHGACRIIFSQGHLPVTLIHGSCRISAMAICQSRFSMKDVAFQS